MSLNLTSALDVVSDAVLARLDGPLEKVRGLPNQAYTSQAFFELEQQTLFRALLDLRRRRERATRGGRCAPGGGSPGGRCC